MSAEELVAAARKRAQIRRQIRSEKDRIADQLDALCDEIEALSIKVAAADLRADRMCAALEALSGGECIPIPGTWRDGFRAAINKLHACIDGTPDNYLDHCLAVARNNADRLAAQLNELKGQYAAMERTVDEYRVFDAQIKEENLRYWRCIQAASTVLATGGRMRKTLDPNSWEDRVTCAIEELNKHGIIQHD